MEKVKNLHTGKAVLLKLSVVQIGKAGLENDVNQDMRHFKQNLMTFLELFHYAKYRVQTRQLTSRTSSRFKIIKCILFQNFSLTFSQRTVGRNRKCNTGFGNLYSCRTLWCWLHIWKTHRQYGIMSGQRVLLKVRNHQMPEFKDAFTSKATILNIVITT